MPSRLRVQQVTQLAHQLDDDVRLEAEGDAVVLERIPASYRSAAEWARGVLDEVVLPLLGATKVREVKFEEDVRPAMSRPRRMAR